MEINYIQEFFLNCICQNIIPIEVKQNWKSPMFSVGTGRNYSFEITIFTIFIKEILNQEKLNGN